MTTLPILTALNTYLSLCDTVYQVLQDENRQLSQKLFPLEPSRIQHKRTLINELHTQNDTLKLTLAQSPIRTPHMKQTIQSIQAKLLKILMLNRDNEQLFIQLTLAHSIPTPSNADPLKTPLNERPKLIPATL